MRRTMRKAEHVDEWATKAADQIATELGQRNVRTYERIASIIAAHAEPLVAELAEIRNEWESCCLREVSTFAELKEWREQVAALRGAAAGVQV